MYRFPYSMLCMTILSSFLAHHHCTHQATHEWAINLVITDGHFNLPQLFVWVCIGSHTHFIQRYVWPYSLLSWHITTALIRPHMNGLSTWWIQMATLIFLFVWVCIGFHTRFIQCYVWPYSLLSWHITTAHIKPHMNGLSTWWLQMATLIFLFVWVMYRFPYSFYSMLCMTILSSFLAHHHCTHQATHEWAINLVITDGHFNLPQLFAWVCIGFHTHFIQYYVWPYSLLSWHIITADIRPHMNGLSTWWLLMATLIYLSCLCGYV